MGKKKGKKKKKSMLTKIGDFQENVGKATAPVTNIGNKVAAAFMIIFGIIVIIMGISVREMVIIGFGIFIIFLAFIVSYASSVWTKQVQTNRTAAQIEGTMFEARMARNVFDILTK